MKNSAKSTPTAEQQNALDPRGNAESPTWPVKSDRTVEERLSQIESLLLVLVEQQTVREWYSVEQFAQRVGKAVFTCREWCRLGRVHAEKKSSGRGAYPAWAISHAEVERYEREGLLPIRKPR